jgi:hypothetical protein
MINKADFARILVGYLSRRSCKKTWQAVKGTESNERAHVYTLKLMDGRMDKRVAYIYILDVNLPCCFWIIAKKESNTRNKRIWQWMCIIRNRFLTQNLTCLPILSFLLIHVRLDYIKPTRVRFFLQGGYVWGLEGMCHYPKKLRIIKGNMDIFYRCNIYWSIFFIVKSIDKHRR